MADLETLQARVDELIALVAILGEMVDVEVLDPPELLVAVREGVFDSSSHVHLAGLPIRLTLALMATSAAGAAGDSGPATRLYARLPPRYPMQPLLVEAVTCSELGRQWEDSCRGRLQLLADAAGAPSADGSSGGGQGCLYPLVQVLLEAVQEEQHQLEQLAADGDSAPPTAVTATGSATSSAQQQQARQQPPEQQPEVMLLRLHHMHDRSGYCKTIRRWALALGLAGRLLFCGGSSSPLILILLEGPAEGLRQYLVRQRTQLVDVDSRGRPCRERMLDVVCSPPVATGCSAGSSTSNSSSGTSSRSSLFADFREEEVGVRQLASLLRAAGLEQHWAAATGLPALPE